MLEEIMMIDKLKTIKKAVGKYKDIYPVKGKTAISDCFFCLRGEYFFIFRTKDRKIHKMRVEKERQVVSSLAINRDTFNSIFRTLNTPIMVRSLITRKPVKTCLVNLFPVPGIAWSAGQHPTKEPLGDGKNIHENSKKTQPGQIWTAQAGATMHRNMPDNRIVTPQLNRISMPEHRIEENTQSYRYEILSGGSLPVHPSNLMPALENSTDCSNSYYPSAGSEVQPDIIQRGSNYSSEQPAGYHSYHYEILATGNLPIHPSEWMPDIGMFPQNQNQLQSICRHQDGYHPVKDYRQAEHDQYLIADIPSQFPERQHYHRPREEWTSWSDSVVDGCVHERPAPEWDFGFGQQSWE